MSKSCTGVARHTTFTYRSGKECETLKRVDAFSVTNRDDDVASVDVDDAQIHAVVL